MREWECSKSTNTTPAKDYHIFCYIESSKSNLGKEKIKKKKMQILSFPNIHLLIKITNSKTDGDEFSIGWT